MNQPFIDGNRRVAFFATDVFLRLNGWQLEVDGPKAHRFLLRHLEGRTMTFKVLETWVRQSIRRV